MDKEYSITLADGTIIDRLCLNGTNFVSKTPVSANTFKGNCSPMTISDGETNEVHENAALIHITKYGDEFWFAFRDISIQEIKEAKIRSDIDYIAMMTDTDLEEV